MGVNITTQIVRGYYLKESQIKEAGLSDDGIDELLNDTENVHFTSPMTDMDIIFGRLLLKSADGRYEPMDIPMTNLSDLILKSKQEDSDRDILQECVPEKLHDIAMIAECDFHIFTCYS